MKAKINYKSKRTIIIVAIALVVLIAAIVGTVAFIKGNRSATAAMPDDENGSATITTPDNNSDSDGNGNANNGGTEEQVAPIIGEDGENAGDAQTNPDNDGQNDGTTTTGTTTTGTTTTGTGTTTTTTGTTNPNVPNQDYTQTTVIPGEDRLVEENTKIGWSPIEVPALVAAANLGINKPDLESVKLAYVQGDSLDELPTNTAIQRGEIITYVIKVANKGNLDATSIRTIDEIPAGTELVEDSIVGEGTVNNGKITWKTDIKAEETVELSFQVKVVADSITIIENTAKVNGQNTNTTQNPVITSVKQAQVVIVKGGEEALENRDAKVGETIRYTITARNTSEVDGTTIITDKVPAGTTYVDGSASEGAVVSDDGTIIWENVTVPAEDETTVSFDVTVNKEIYNEETQQNEPVKSVKNAATVGTIPTGPVETEVANITTTKASQGSATPLHELDTITYRLMATNYGNGTGTVTISDEVPVGTTLDKEVGVRLTGDQKIYSEEELKQGIPVTLQAGETKIVTFIVKINAFKIGDANVTEENGKTIRTIDNLVATQDGETITPGTSDEVEKEYVTVTANKDFVDNNGVDGKRPASVELELYADGKTTGKTATTDANWKVEFTQLDKYTEAGQLIKYSVKENNVNEYYEDTYSTPVVEGNHTTIKITNTLKYEMIKRSVEATKVWVDGDNKAGVRPDSVEFELYADNATTNKTQTVSKVEGSNEWKTAFGGVNKYTPAGKEIEYSVRETTTPAYYNKQENGLTVTNKIDYTLIPTTVTATKNWDDAENANRPTKVVIGVYNGSETPVKTAEANSSNGWTATFEGLQKYTAEGEEIKYTFKEVTIPDGYVATVKDNVITNALPRIEVTKTVKSINGADATTVNSSTVKENDIIEYQITVKNTGSVTVNDITVTESLNVYLDANKPDEKTTSVGTISELKANESQTFKVYYKVVAEDVDNVNENLVNVATAKGKYTDGNGTEQEVTDDGRISVTPTEINDLSITKSQKVNEKEVTTDTKVVPGDVITYTIIVKNTGNTVLNNVEVTDSMLTNSNFVLTNNGGFTLENEKLKIATLALNETKTITAKYTVQESDMSETVGTIANTATAKSDKVPEESSKVEVPTEAWYADISTTKRSVGSASPLHELDTITYTLSATNNGTDDGTVKLSDTVPTGTTLVANSIRLEGVNTPYTEVQLNSGIEVHLNAGETKTLTFSVKINPFESATINVVNNTAKQDETPITGTTDTVVKEYTSVTVSKTWVDNEIQAQRRPTQIRFELYADNNNEPTRYYDMSKTESSYTFENLSKYNPNGTPITYTVQEKEINTGDLKFYTSSVAQNDPTVDANGNKTYHFTNTFTKPTDTTNIKVTKIWDDNTNAASKRPNSVKLHLNNEAVVLTADNATTNGNEWSTELTKPVYNNNGEEITYTLTEKEENIPQWYIASVDGYTVTNTFKAPTDQKYDITITKVWDDNKNEAGKRPTSIKLTLNKIDVAGDTVKVKDITLTGDSKAEQWTATENVQKYDEKANVIQYFVTEESTGSMFYINTDTDATDLTVTNKFVVPNDKAELTVRKIWNDNNNTSKRTSVTIRVTGNGKSEDVTLTSNNANANNGNIWERTVTATTLPKYDNLGNVINYSYDEVTVPTGYIRTVNGNEVTNSLPGIKVTKSVVSVTDKDGKKTDTTGVDQITVKENDVIEYLITVENLGTVELTNVNVTDNLKVYTDKADSETTTNTLLTNGTLAVGETKTYTVYYKVSANDVKVGGQTLRNIATATGEYTDTNKVKQTITDNDTADVTIADAPGVSIVKSQKVNGKEVTTDTKVVPGDVITYTITVTNTGNTVLNNVTVTDSMTGKEGFTITSGNLNIGTLGIAPNNVETITATYTVRESDMKETESKIENTATVKTSSTPDTSSTVEVPTEAWYANINVTKSSELIKNTTLGNKISGKAEYGDTIKYTITATNNGKKTGTVDVTDKVPTGTELIPYANNSTNLTSEELAKLTTEAGLTKTLSVAGKNSTSIYFTVKVTAKPGEEIVNTAILPEENNKQVPDGGQNVEKRVSVVTKTETPKITNSNVVIVLDVSGSMDYKLNNNSRTTRLDKAKDVVQDFINTINLPADGSGSSISVVTFSGASYGDTSGTGYTKVLSVDRKGNTIANTTTEANYLANTSVENLTANGGTCISGALTRATQQVNLLKAAKPQNQNIVIFVGDGKPEGDAGDIPGEAEKLKATGATVYAIGFTQDIDVLKNTVASSPDKYYTTSQNVDLSDVFTKIGSDITPTLPVGVDSQAGLIELTNINISKDIIIRVKANGATDFEETTGKYNATNPTEDDQYIQDKITINAETGVYYLDLSQFNADDTIEIDYFVNESQD